MIEPLYSLASLRAVVAVAENLSFTKAGEALGVSSSAIGKSVARIEAHLSASLFNRTTRSISVTEAGALFLVRARRVLDELQAVEGEVAELSGTPKGRLRVSLPLAGSLFTDAIGTFVERYPLVKLELDYTDRMVDLIEEGYDVAIRTGKTGDSRLLQKSLGNFGWCIAASPAYIEKYGQPSTVVDLKNHICLRQKFAHGQMVPWPFRADSRNHIPISLTANVIDPLLEMALSGVGIAAFPKFACNDDIKSGKLISLLNHEVEKIASFSIIWPASRFRVPKVRAFVDTIHNAIRSKLLGSL